MNDWPAKDADEVLDYRMEWADRLETAETIATSTFILAQGTVELGDDDIVDTDTVVWISAGTTGEVNIITNRITTSAGRTWDESARLRIRAR